MLTTPDRQLRSHISHGVPEVNSLARISYFAAPHGSAYSHYDAWVQQTAKERERGWARAGFERSYGLATWPTRVQPTSMVERRGSWRLCHDMSWPPSGSADGVESPNDADYWVLVVAFCVLSQLALAAMIFVAAGLPVKLFKFDLSKAYKRTGEQRASTWRRVTWSDLRSQTLDRTCFGQRNGPESFSRQSTSMVFVMRRELAFMCECYPSRDPRVVAFVRLRLLLASRSAVPDPRSWAALFFVMAMIDDFGAAIVDDLLFRCDGSAVLDSSGRQRRRASMGLEVCESVVARYGHRLEKDDPLKYSLPCDCLLLLGGYIDLGPEELVFDDDKRSRYAEALKLVLEAGSVAPSMLTSLAFKMLCVSECYPLARQWISPLFRALRGRRVSRIDLSVESDVANALDRLFRLLCSDVRLAVPLACRHSFPFASFEHLAVIFADASGPPAPFDPPVGSVPGYGAWTVRGTELSFFDGLWSEREAGELSITVLEAVVSFWALMLFTGAASTVSHVLEFSDNSGVEWSARRETPSAEFMQRVAERRATFLQSSGLFSRPCRVPSASNLWADALSRQRRDAVVAEARSLGLSVVMLRLPDAMRDVSWLLA